MAKPRPTAADYMVTALSPALIIALVGSLCFFLIDVRFQGRPEATLCWVMFWFVLAIVLISRIAIEQGAERAALFGFALGSVSWLFLIRFNSSAYLLSVFLMALVWYCAHKLVWDCTLIDEDKDASGQGLLGPAKTDATVAPSKPAAGKTAVRKAIVRKEPESPGRWVIYFSLAALPLFGLGQVVLPANDGRKLGFVLLAIYLTAALGLLVTTSFLGLRRYLRQRYLAMPASIALAWVKFGAGVALVIVIGAAFLPRPGVTAVWTGFRGQVDYRLRQASQYACGRQSPGSAQGRAGDQAGDSQNQNDSDNQNRASGGNEDRGTSKSDDNGARSKPQPLGGQTDAAAPAPPLTGAAAKTYLFFRNGLLAAALLVAGFWLFRCRHLLMEMFRAAIEAIRRFLALSMPKAVRPVAPEPVFSKRRPLADFKNPFFSDAEHSRPASEIILYTYDALQAWAREHGTALHPEQTPREFCREMETQLPALATALHHLSYLHAHAAYGRRLPANCDLEPLKELWRELTWK